MEFINFNLALILLSNQATFSFQLFREVRIMKFLDHPNIGKYVFCLFPSFGCIKWSLEWLIVIVYICRHCLIREVKNAPKIRTCSLNKL